MTESATLVLEYAGADASRDRRLPLPLRGVFFCVALVAAVTPFLPFAVGTSPLDVVRVWERSWDFNLMLVGLPFFAGVFGAVWRLRLFVGHPWRAERALLYGVALVLGAANVVLLFRGIDGGDFKVEELLQILVGPGVALAWAVGAVWLRRRGRRDEAVTAALAGAYLGNAAMCLLIFAPSSDIGWRVTAGVVLGLVSETVTTLVWAARSRRG